MKWLIGIFLWLPTLAYAGDDMARALEAFNTANYKLAQQTWEYVANQGNVVAQYNLAYLYRNGIGVETNDDKATRMERSAAHGNLVDAYNQLLANAVQPATREDGLQAIAVTDRSEEHTSQLQSHSFISYAVFCLKKKK